MKGQTAFVVYDGGCWFRILGYGLRCVNREKHPAPHSEREGYQKVLRIGRWSIAMLDCDDYKKLSYALDAYARRVKKENELR